RDRHVELVATWPGRDARDGPGHRRRRHRLPAPGLGDPMNPLVAAIVLVASLVLALGATRQAAVGRSVLLLAAMAIAADLPAVFNARREAAFLACWACVLANTAGVY